MFDVESDPTPEKHITSSMVSLLWEQIHILVRESYGWNKNFNQWQTKLVYLHLGLCVPMRGRRFLVCLRVFRCPNWKLPHLLTTQWSPSQNCVQNVSIWIWASGTCPATIFLNPWMETVSTLKILQKICNSSHELVSVWLYQTKSWGILNMIGQEFHDHTVCTM